MIAELTESVTKKATPVKADVAGSTLEKEADVWIRQQRQLRKQKRLLKASKRRWKQILQLLVIKHRQNYDPEYKDALGKTVPEVVINSGTAITPANSTQMKDAVAALKATHDAAVKAEATFQAKTLPVVV